MRIRKSFITNFFIFCGVIGLFAFRVSGDNVVLGVGGLGLLVFGAVASVFMIAFNAHHRVKQMKIVAHRTGFELLRHKTPLRGEIPSGLFGISWGSDIWPESADFTQYFPGFDYGIKRAVGPAAYGTDKNGVIWFILQYEYTDSAYHGMSQSFAIVLAKTKHLLPTMSLQDNGGIGSPTIAYQSSLQESHSMPKGGGQNFEVKYSAGPGSRALMTPEFMEVLRHLPNFDFSMSGPYVMACIFDEERAEIFLSMRASIKKILEAIPDDFDYPLQHQVSKVPPLSGSMNPLHRNKAKRTGHLKKKK